MISWPRLICVWFLFFFCFCSLLYTTSCQNECNKADKHHPLVVNAMLFANSLLMYSGPSLYYQRSWLPGYVVLMLRLHQSICQLVGYISCWYPWPVFSPQRELLFLLPSSTLLYQSPASGDSIKKLVVLGNLLSLTSLVFTLSSPLPLCFHVDSFFPPTWN